jgi:PBP1b-binding outer membrane lipoprotein LpoB
MRAMVLAILLALVFVGCVQEQMQKAQVWNVWVLRARKQSTGWGSETNSLL